LEVTAELHVAASLACTCRYAVLRPDCVSGRAEHLLSRHEPTTHDATPLPPNARCDTTNVHLKLRAFALCSPFYYFFDVVPFPLSLRLFLSSEVTPHFPTVASLLLHRRDTVPPLTKISNKDLSIILHMSLHTLAYTVCGRFSHTGLIPVFDPGFRIP
jgi:hypothetical protein